MRRIRRGKYTRITLALHPGYARLEIAVPADGQNVSVERRLIV